MGKVAALAETPSLIAVGDSGTLSGRPFQVMGRVQLDHGLGPWDEYYVGFDYGADWGWLAYAQGHWIVTTSQPGHQIPPYGSLAPEMDVPLGQAGVFRVAEVKSGRIVSSEGELPGAFPPGFVRYYADLYGPNDAFATLDYGDGQGAYTVFVGWVFDETRMQVTQAGPRTTRKVQTQYIKCPGCGGDVPKLSGDRAQRMGCPYCGAVTDIGLQQVVAQQEAAMAQPEIPIGSRGVFEGVEYVCIAYVRRSTSFDGEPFAWEEYLVWSQPVGYRWLVKDEGRWTWVLPVNLAELDMRGMPHQVVWGGRVFSQRNQNPARVDYVVGEVYWKCQVGETTQNTDFVNGEEVLSREQGEGEVRWSYAAPVSWAMVASAFGVPLAGAAAAAFDPPPPRSGLRTAAVMGSATLGLLMSCTLMTCGGCGGGGRPPLTSSYMGMAAGYPRSYSSVYPSYSGSSSRSGSSSGYRSGSYGYSGGK